MALSWTMDKIGPMCRTAEDCGIVLQAIAGKDDKDPGTAAKSFYFAPQFAKELNQIRVGFSSSDFDSSLDPSLRAPFQAAFEAIKSMGVSISEISLGNLPYGTVSSTVISAEGASAFEELIESGKVDELADKKQIAGLRAGLEIGARDYLRAMRVRRLIQQEFRRLLTGVDVILAPARYSIASKLSEPLDRPTPPGPGLREAQAGMRALIGASNLAGLPALTLPCGFSQGMPVAIQLVSRPFTENMILSIGIEYQKRTEWHRQRPKDALIPA
jgi:aspartyl-tRNA(Asn)/glutamyl-tRNA(Gln) amidotransferase subunit A